MRKKIYEIIEPAEAGNRLSNAYDLLMMATIIVSIIPLAFKETKALFHWIDYVTVIIFIADYLLRLFVADIKIKKSVASFILYPITPMAMIDLVSILPRICETGREQRCDEVDEVVGRPREEDCSP